MAGTNRHDLYVLGVVATNPATVVAGDYAFMAESSAFGGGSIKLQVLSPNGTWIDVTGASLTANGMVILSLPAGQYKAVLGGAPANACAYLISIPRY